MNIKEMDQNNWVCYQFGDNSYYYGEVGILDEAGIVHSKDNAEMAVDPKSRLVKHGFGIYIYDDPQGQCRYEGFWDRDRKSGKGTVNLKNGSVYEGQFRDGCYHDAGVMKWPNGDVYDGKWKKNRMDGPGCFKRHDGFALKGSFKNNYYIDGNVLRNPFLPDSEYEQLKKRRKQLIKQYEKNEKIKSGYFQRIEANNTEKLLENISRSKKNNRVPLFVSSEESKVYLPQVVGQLKEKGKEIRVIDLRKSFVLKGEERYHYIEQINEACRSAVVNGEILILSLDDSEEADFEEIFYPEIKELYTSNGFNSCFWAPQDLSKVEIRSKIIGEAVVHDNFQFLVWSKVKIRQVISDDFIMEKLQKRFESVIPFIKIDIIFAEESKEKGAQS